MQKNIEIVKRENVAKTKGTDRSKTFITTAIHELEESGYTIVFTAEQVKEISSRVNVTIKHNDGYYTLLLEN